MIIMKPWHVTFFTSRKRKSWNHIKPYKMLQVYKKSRQTSMFEYFQDKAPGCGPKTMIAAYWLSSNNFNKTNSTARACFFECFKIAGTEILLFSKMSTS